MPAYKRHFYSKRVQCAHLSQNWLLLHKHSCPPQVCVPANSFSAVCSGIVVPAKWAKLHRSACQGSEKLIKVLHSPNLMSFIFLMWMGWLTHKILALNFSGKIMEEEEGPSQAFPPNCMLGGKLPSCCIIRKEHQFLNKLHRNGRDLVTCTWEWVCYSKKHPDSVNHFRVTHLKQLL